jgi:hypothetical protein
MFSNNCAHSKVIYDFWPVNSALVAGWSLYFSLPVIKATSQLLYKLSTTIHPLKTEQLYLWSSADPLTEEAHIKDIIASQQRRGIICISHNFKTSTHVGHLRQFPERYVELVKTFTKKALIDS